MVCCQNIKVRICKENCENSAHDWQASIYTNTE